MRPGAGQCCAGKGAFEHLHQEVLLLDLFKVSTKTFYVITQMSSFIKCTILGGNYFSSLSRIKAW